MADVPTADEMPEVLEKTIESAAAALGPEEVTRLSGVMKALCLKLNDTECSYYVTFMPDGTGGFGVEDPGVTPMLTISTTTETFHNMCTGVTDPARAFALRKVKMSGVPLMSLSRVGGNLLDALFKSYTEVVGAR
jgi:putative sterol carrier protein